MIERIESGSLTMLDIRSRAPILTSAAHVAACLEYLKGLVDDATRQLDGLSALVQEVNVRIERSFVTALERIDPSQVAQTHAALETYRAELDQIKYQLIPEHLQQLGAPLTVDFSVEVAKLERQVAIYEVKSYLCALELWYEDKRAQAYLWKLETYIENLGSLLFRSRPGPSGTIETRYDFADIQKFLEYFPSELSPTLFDLKRAGEAVLSHYRSSHVVIQHHVKNFEKMLRHLGALLTKPLPLRRLGDLVTRATYFHKSNTAPRIDMAEYRDLTTAHPNAARCLEAVDALEAMRAARIKAQAVADASDIPREEKVNQIEHIQVAASMITLRLPAVDDADSSLSIFRKFIAFDYATFNDLITQLRRF